MPDSPSRRSELTFLFLANAVLLIFVVIFALGPHCFFWIDDFQNQYLAAYREIAGALASKEFPWLSVHSQFGGALAGEYQYAIFSLPFMFLNFLVWELTHSLEGAATLLVGAHLFILLNGVYFLARRQNQAPAIAAFSAVVVALSGWIVQWGRAWFPALGSFCWLPWVWFSFLAKPSVRLSYRVASTAFFSYAVLSGGWPFTALMLIALSGWFLLKSWFEHRAPAALFAPLLGLALGACLAGPALLSFVFFFHTTSRSINPPPDTAMWTVPIQGLVDLFLPTYGANWSTWFGSKHRAGIELFCGLSPAVALLAVFLERKLDFIRKYRWEIGFLGLVTLFCLIPGIGQFRWAFRWLPLFHLLIGLLGGEALGAFYSNEFPSESSVSRFHPSRNLGSLAFILLLIIAVLSYCIGNDACPRLSVLLMGVAAFWSCESVLKRTSLRVTLSLLVAALTLGLSHWFLDQADAPHWGYTQQMVANGALQKNRRYLSFFSWSTAYFLLPKLGPSQGTLLRPGNSAMYADLDFVNGYSPTEPTGLKSMFGFEFDGFIQGNRAAGWLRDSAVRRVFLKAMAVDGIVLSRDYDALGQFLSPRDWNLVERTSEGSLYHRIGGLTPRVGNLSELLEQKKGGLNQVGNAANFSTARIQQVNVSRNQVDLKLNNDGGNRAVIYFSRAWFPGYRAFFNGKEIPVNTFGKAIPAVEIPPRSEGVLHLTYTPEGVVAGLWLTSLGFLAWFGLFGWEVVSQRKNRLKIDHSVTPFSESYLR